MVTALLPHTLCFHMVSQSLCVLRLDLGPRTTLTNDPELTNGPWAHIHIFKLSTTHSTIIIFSNQYIYTKVNLLTETSIAFS